MCIFLIDFIELKNKFFQQIPNAGNPVQLMTNNKEGASVPFKMGNNVQQLPSGAQPSSGSQLAQQQVFLNCYFLFSAK